MELSRRGVLGGVGAVCAAGAVGFVGATSVDDPIPAGAGDGNGEETGDGGDGTGDGGSRYVPVDPDAPFGASLREGAGSSELFDASDLEHVEGVYSEGNEFHVVLELSAGGREALRAGLEAAGASDYPEPFGIVMTLDGETVREVDLDGPTVDALVDDEFDGVVTLPFEDEAVAESVYGSLADDRADPGR